MNKFKEHSINCYLSEPLKGIGLTLDEIALGALCLISSLAFKSIVLKGLFAQLTSGSVYVDKRLWTRFYIPHKWRINH